VKVCVVGTGYVGLVAGACFAELGNSVICVDNNAEKIEKLKNGIIPIFEPGLEELVGKNVSAKRLSFSTEISFGVKSSEVIFIAVGTPPKQNGEADLSFVEKVACEIAKSIDSYKVVVEKSTVPVETGEKIAKVLSQGVENELFDVVSNPEFLREGSAIKDFLEPDRIVVGTESEKARKIMQELYKPLKAPIIFTDVKSAEIIKHASNSFLATKISFINSVARVCELTGADVRKVAEGMGLDDRIGRSFLNAGIGYGGSCFPKDVAAFIKISQKAGFDFGILKEVEKINKEQRQHFLKKVEEALWVVKDKTIAVFGLAFKPNTDDLREAPSIDIINALHSEGARVKAFDPKAMSGAKEFIQGVEFCKSAEEALKGADCLLLLTEWDDFKKIDLKRMKSLMKNPLVVDGRNFFRKEEMQKLGFNYVGVGV